MASKVANDPERPSLGRTRADSVAPPHSPISIKRCIARVERTPELAHANIFADTSCDTPLKEGYISILRTYDPGVSPNEPMAIVQMPIVQVESPPISDGRYFILNHAWVVNPAWLIYWSAKGGPFPLDMVRFWHYSSSSSYDGQEVPVISNYSSAQRIIFFRSGSSQIMLMVASLSDQYFIHPRGLVMNLLSLRRQFRGD